MKWPSDVLHLSIPEFGVHLKLELRDLTTAQADARKILSEFGRCYRSEPKNYEWRRALRKMKMSLVRAANAAEYHGHHDVSALYRSVYLGMRLPK
jgi:hypothetical protein